jgi:hypothetical protein
LAARLHYGGECYRTCSLSLAWRASPTLRLLFPSPPPPPTTRHSTCVLTCRAASHNGAETTPLGRAPAVRRGRRRNLLTAVGGGGLPQDVDHQLSECALAAETRRGGDVVPAFAQRVSGEPHHRGCQSESAHCDRGRPPGPAVGAVRAALLQRHALCPGPGAYSPGFKCWNVLFTCSVGKRL